MIFVAKDPKQQRTVRGGTADWRTNQKTRQCAQDRAASQSNCKREQKVWPFATIVARK
jgi:hypothetical protein